MSRRLRIWGDFLCFDERLVVPKELQNDILEKVHNQTHFGQVGTIQALKKSYFWVKMSWDAKNVCWSCVVCQRSKPSNKSKPARTSMDIAKTDIESIHQLNPLSNCVHVVVSYDEAYQMRSSKSGRGIQPLCFRLRNFSWYRQGAFLWSRVNSSSSATYTITSDSPGPDYGIS